MCRYCIALYSYLILDIPPKISDVLLWYIPYPTSVYESELLFSSITFVLCPGTFSSKLKEPILVMK